MKDWSSAVAAQLAATRAADRWRVHRSFDALGRSGLLPDGRRVVDLASNDYLGLSSHPRVIDAAHAALDRWGTGSGASRLVTGSRPVHHDLEAALADWKHAEGAVVFPTGYAANLGVIGALCTAATSVGGRVRIFSDQLNHASIIDGARLARAEVVVFAHRDHDALAHHLHVAGQDGVSSLVVSDAVFSMDGDAADVTALATLCEARGALLVIDEAHVLWTPDVPLDARPGGMRIVRVGTLSKALGSIGGFVAADRSVCDLVINTARTQIFSTAMPPSDAAAALAALEILTSVEGAALVARVRAHTARVVGHGDHASAIVPVIVGGEADAVAASAALLERGLLVPAIRPPTVAPGTSRLRIALSAAHTDADIDALVDGLAALGLGGFSSDKRPTSVAATTKLPPTPARSRRPRRVCVLGTGTEVGKTWVSAYLLSLLAADGVAVAARKPAQSFDPADPHPLDATVLAGATGEPTEVVCRPDRTFPVPLAPPMAARVLGLAPLRLAEMVASISWPVATTGRSVVLVEGAGGVASPIAEDGDGLALAVAMEADVVVLVADAGLGTINAVRTAARPLVAVGLPVIVVLNRFDPSIRLHRDNFAWLTDVDGFDVVAGTPDGLGAIASRLAPPTAINVRRIRSDDVADLAAAAAIHHRGWVVAYRGMVPDALLDAMRIADGVARWKQWAEADFPGRIVFVAERAGRIEGIMLMATSRDPELAPTGSVVAEVQVCYAEPAAWGSGVGAALLGAVPEAAGLVAPEATEATLWVLEANSRARTGYERAGWRPDGARKLERIGGRSLIEVRYRVGLERAAAN